MKKAKRISGMNRPMVAACLWLAASFPGAGAAAPLPGATDGCEMLAQAVEHAVLNAVSQGSWQAMNNILAGALSGGGSALAPTACDATTQIVSAGFYAGLQHVGIDVWWNPGFGNPLHHCLSHDLRLCYPTSSVTGFGSPADSRFVLDSWQAIRTGVIGSMPGGPPTNLAAFSAQSISASLAASLGTQMSGSLASYHRSIVVGGF